MQRLAWQCTRGVLITDGPDFYLIEGGAVVAHYSASQTSEWDELTTISYAIEGDALRETHVYELSGFRRDTRVTAVLEGLVPTDPTDAAAVLARKQASEDARKSARRDAGRARAAKILAGRRPEGLEVLIARLEYDPEDALAIALLEALAAAPSPALANAARVAMFARVEEKPPPAPPPTGPLAALHALLLQHAEWMEYSDSNGTAAAYVRAAAWVAAAAVTDPPAPE